MSHIGPGGTGTILRAQGAGNSPTYSTGTYPDVGGSIANVLTSDGVNWISQPPPISSQLVLIQSLTAVNSAAIVFNDTTYNNYLLIVDSLDSNGLNVVIQITVTTDSGSTYLTTNYKGGVGEMTFSTGIWQGYNFASSSFNVSTNSITTASNYSASIWLSGMNSTTKKMSMRGEYVYHFTNTIPTPGIISCLRSDTQQINGLKIFMSSSANINSGVFTLYGLKVT